MFSLIADCGSDEFEAILGPTLSDRTDLLEIERLSKAENETLHNTLTAIRIGGWFCGLDRSSDRLYFQG
jgi:hypothetical protein